MAENGRKKEKTLNPAKRELRVIWLLAAGNPIAEVAILTGVSERTIYRRLREPEFQAALIEAREVMVDQAIGDLASSTGKATQTLKELLDSKNERVRLMAADRIIMLYLKARDFVEIEAKAEAIENALAARFGQPGAMTV